MSAAPPCWNADLLLEPTERCAEGLLDLKTASQHSIAQLCLDVYFQTG